MIVEIKNSDISNLKGKAVVLDFYADWCQPCKNLSPILEGLSDKYSDVILAKCNVEENDDLTDKYEVRNIPSLIFISEDGEITNKWVGFKDINLLEDSFKNIVKN